MHYLKGINVTSWTEVPHPRFTPTNVSNFNITTLDIIEANVQIHEVGVNSLSKFQSLVVSSGYLVKK